MLAIFVGHLWAIINHKHFNKLGMVLIILTLFSIIFIDFKYITKSVGETFNI